MRRAFVRPASRLLIAFCLTGVNIAVGQQNIVPFSTADVGVSRPVTTWGVGTIGGADVIKSGLIYMGADRLTVVIMPFSVLDPLTDAGELSDAAKKEITDGLAMFDLSGAKWLAISAGVGGPDSIGACYISGPNRVNTGRWAQCIIATNKFINRPVEMVQPFNEPEFGPWQEGSPQDLADIMGLLQRDPSFRSTRMAGPATLNVDFAVEWYNAIKSKKPIGTTHVLNGSMDSYSQFFKTVHAGGGATLNPELHSLAEAVVGAEYGMDGGIWWLRCDLARGEFAKACAMKRVGYYEDRTRLTVAAVYHKQSGQLQAFIGAFERNAQATTYTLVCKDRDVFFNGDGPRREFTVNTSAHKEQVVSITWGDDVPPVINGSYVIANRKSGKVLEAVDASNKGSPIQQDAYSGQPNQEWKLTPFTPDDGDQSYYEFTSAGSGLSMDVVNFSYDDGGSLQLWDNLKGLNQLWFLEYAGDNCFYIRNRLSGKYLDVTDGSLNDHSNVAQWSSTKGQNQQWRLLPVGSPVDLIPPAAPTELKAAVTGNVTHLVWKANSEADFSSYTVLRAKDARSPYDIVAREVTTPSWDDKSTVSGKAYSYIVKAVDRSLNTSPGSSAATSAAR